MHLARGGKGVGSWRYAAHAVHFWKVKNEPSGRW